MSSTLLCEFDLIVNCIYPFVPVKKNHIGHDVFISTSIVSLISNCFSTNRTLLEVMKYHDDKLILGDGVDIYKKVSGASFHVTKCLYCAAYCVVATESSGRQLPIGFIERVKEDFSKKYSGGKARNANANGLKREYGYVKLLLH